MNYDEIKQLVELFEQTDLTELELTRDNSGLRLSRKGAAGASAPASVQPPAAAPVTEMTAAPSLDALEKIVASVQGTTAGSAGDISESAASGSEKGTVVTAPIVGTFYAGSAPDQPPYVKVGDIVAEGDTLCIIEAMKFMNEVPSTVGGKISEILVKDGDFVEFGQPLFCIE